ncbi:hypothetical protein [Rhizobium sp. BR 249]
MFNDSDYLMLNNGLAQQMQASQDAARMRNELMLKLIELKMMQMRNSQQN